MNSCSLALQSYRIVYAKGEIIIDTIIRNTLRPFGITRNYRGYPQTVFAIALVIEDEARLRHIMTDIYEVVAVQIHCKAANVGRNIRTVILCAWRKNRALLCEMAGYPVVTPPSVSQFLDVVASYIQRNPFPVPAHQS